jgi:hypothetical protein
VIVLAIAAFTNENSIINRNMSLLVIGNLQNFMTNMGLVIDSWRESFVSGRDGEPQFLI